MLVIDKVINDESKHKNRNKGLIYHCTFLMIIIACISFAQGGYILAKAQFAQYLLLQAWQVKKTASNKPWPWADFYPVATLYFERFNEEQIVLNNDSGQALAFGPGLNQYASFNLESPPKVVVISAHNDTHFRLLKDLKLDDRITLTLKTGVTHQFKVNNLSVIDLDTEQLVLNKDTVYEREDYAGMQYTDKIQELILVTCYPFGGVSSETNLRYIVKLI